MLAATGVAAAAVIPASAGAPKPAKVIVGDDYYSPVKLKVAKGRTVVWKWLSVNGNSHDVKLKRGPKGVKKFHSDLAAADFTYKRKLKVKGRYSIICTIHVGMVQTITVR
jgi:plastocyanin